jgi:WD40 repeat protein
LQEFVYDKISQDGRQLYNLKTECITNLKNRYYDDFSYLVGEYATKRRGDIDSILEDIRTVIEWSKEKELINLQDIKNENYINQVTFLGKILEQESHNLRTKEKNSFISSLPSTGIEKSSVFAQQIHIRSTDLSNKEIVDKSREFLLQSKNPHLDIIWAKVRNTEALIRTLEGHADNINSVAITSDNTKIVSGSRDKTIKVWELNTGKLLNTLEGHTSSISSVAITSDNSKIVSGSYDKTMKVWELNTGNYYLFLKFDSGISTVNLSKYGNLIAIGTYSGNMYMGKY